MPSCAHTGNLSFSFVGADLSFRPWEGAYAGAPLQELFLLLAAQLGVNQRIILKYYTNRPDKPTSFPHKKSGAPQGAPLVLRLRPVPGQPQVCLRLFLPPPPAYQAQAQQTGAHQEHAGRDGDWVVDETLTF